MLVATPVLLCCLRLLLPLFLGMTLLTALGLWLCQPGPAPLWPWAPGGFVLCWLAQSVGHRLEGKRPAFFTDLQYLLIGPAWLPASLYRRLHIRY